MCKNVINAFNVVHSTVQLAFFVDKSLTCKNQISPLIRFLKVQVLDYWECTFLLLFADFADLNGNRYSFPSVQIYSTMLHQNEKNSLLNNN